MIPCLDSVGKLLRCSDTFRQGLLWTNCQRGVHFSFALRVSLRCECDTPVVGQIDPVGGQAVVVFGQVVVVFGQVAVVFGQVVVAVFFGQVVVVL